MTFWWREFLDRLMPKPQPNEHGKLCKLLRPAIRKRVDAGMTYDAACDEIETLLHLKERMEYVRAALRKEFSQ